MTLVRKFWSDRNGFIISTELVLVATILVIGMITGVTTIRDAVVQEMGDVAAGIGKLNQSYAYGFVTAHHAVTAGGKFYDFADDCEDCRLFQRNCLTVVCDCTFLYNVGSEN
jgi:Flp pilus assembly pilin Flp